MISGIASCFIHRDSPGFTGKCLLMRLIRVWIEKYETGAFDDDARAADLIQQCEARIAALERLIGKQPLELEFLRKQ